MILRKFDRYLLWLFVYPLLAYCLWTKWAVVTSSHHFDSTTHLDFLRLHVSYFGMIAVWCTLMLLPVKRLLWPRIGVVLTLLYFAATNLSYSAAIYYTGALAPYDVSYYAGLATGNLPLSLAVTEWLTLAFIPALFLASAFWKLRTLYRLAPTTARNHATAFVILMTAASLPPVTQGGEGNLMRPSYVYQLGHFLQEKSIWPQAVAVESYDRNAQALTATRKQHPNIVFIALESVGAQATGIYHAGSAAVTPYLNRLAQSSWVVRNAYAAVPHTSKALVAINCGVNPSFLHPIFESHFGVRERCLADLLAEQGYQTLFMQSPTEHFENRRGTATRLGYRQFIAHEQLDKTGYQLASYFGYEDNILLNPGRAWLEKQTGPFVAFYLTGTSHHPYWVPDHHPQQTFDRDNADRNAYLNAVNYLDRFVEQLIAQYRDTGHYDNTLFVIVGDHGESFGQHPRMQHNASLYQEVMQIPLLIHGPAITGPAKEIPLASQLDIMPTLLSLAGFKAHHAMEGIDLNVADAQREFAIANCWYDDWCMAAADTRFKYIHNFDEKGDELYDLLNDPQERHNIIAQHPEQAARRRAALLDARSHNRQQWHAFLASQAPDYWNRRDATVGTPIALMKLPPEDPRNPPH